MTNTSFIPSASAYVLSSQRELKRICTLALCSEVIIHVGDTSSEATLYITVNQKI